MREKIKDVGRLKHILDAINTLMEHKERYTFEEVEADPILFYGFVKHVEIIGEAVYMLTKEFRAKHDEVDWDVIEGHAPCVSARILPDTSQTIVEYRRA